MRQHPENKCLSVEGILEILRSEVAGMPVSSTSVRYLRALESLQSSVLSLQAATPSEKIQQAPLAKTAHSAKAAQPILSEAPILPKADTASADLAKDNSSLIINNLSLALTNWLVNQWLMNTPFTTASLQLDIISALYGSAVKAGRLPKTKVFSDVKTSLKLLGPEGWKSGIDQEIFTHALRLTKNASRLIADDAIAADLILLSLTHGLLPLEQFALIKKEDIDPAYRVAHTASASEDLRLKTEDCAADTASANTAPRANTAQPILSEAPILPKADTAPADTAQPILSSAPILPKADTARSADTASADTAQPILSEAPILPKADTDPKDPILRSRYSSQVLSIISNNLSLGTARRKYLFPLDQSKRTPAQLKRHIAKICNALFKRARLPQATDPMQTVEALWAYAALRAGIPASALVSHLGHAPLGLPILKLCKSSDTAPRANTLHCLAHGTAVSNCPPQMSPHCVANTAQPILSSATILPKAETERSSNTSSASEDLRLKTEDCAADTAPRANTASASEDLRLKTEDCAANTELRSNLSLEEVGKIFLDNPPRWYAMSLRPGVRFTQVCRRIQLLSKTNTTLSVETSYSGPAADTSASIQLFYPCEEIARAIGKKIVIKQRPFIHSVVFFKAKLTDIGPLFAKIGDLAWCYRQSARPGAPYADITDAQFRQFQQTIARFTPDYEVASTGELELKKNDRVQIVGGLFAGQTASFDSVAHGRAVCNNNTAVKAADTAQSADTPSVVYRLNIIGDNGIEWRISVDSRLAKQKNT